MQKWTALLFLLITVSYGSFAPAFAAWVEPSAETMMTSNSAREVLGVSQDATSDAIKSAYRKLAVKYHPDKHPNDRASEELFKRAALAYERLTDGFEAMSNRREAPKPKTTENDPKPEVRTWTINRPDLTQEAVQQAKMNDIYDFTYAAQPLVSWVEFSQNSAIHYLQKTAELGRASLKTFDRDNGRLRSIDFNKFVQSFAEQIEDDYQLAAFTAVVERLGHPKEHEAKLDVTHFGRFHVVTTSEDYLANLAMRLEAARSVRAPHILSQFNKMIQVASMRGYEYRGPSKTGGTYSAYASSSVDQHNNRDEYSGNLSRYFIAFAEAGSRQELVAEMLFDAFEVEKHYRRLDQRHYTVDIDRFENPYATLAWNLLNIWLEGDPKLLQEIDFSRITTREHLNVIKAFFPEAVKQKLNLGPAAATIQYKLSKVPTEVERFLLEAPSAKQDKKGNEEKDESKQEFQPDARSDSSGRKCDGFLDRLQIWRKSPWRRIF